MPDLFAQIAIRLMGVAVLALGGCGQPDGYTGQVASLGQSLTTNTACGGNLKVSAEVFADGTICRSTIKANWSGILSPPPALTLIDNPSACLRLGGEGSDWACAPLAWAGAPDWQYVGQKTINHGGQPCSRFALVTVSVPSSYCAAGDNLAWARETGGY